MALLIFSMTCVGSFAFASATQGWLITKNWQPRYYAPPQPDDTHTPTIETELTYDYTNSKLPPIDY